MNARQIQAIIDPIREFDHHGEMTSLTLAVLEVALQLAKANERRERLPHVKGARVEQCHFCQALLFPHSTRHESEPCFIRESGADQLAAIDKA